MLVLTRKINEKIRIGTDLVINVISINESQVKLGIEAPLEVKIYREELYERLKQSNIEAAVQSKSVDVNELKNLKIKINTNADKQ